MSQETVWIFGTGTLADNVSDLLEGACGIVRLTDWPTWEADTAAIGNAPDTPDTPASEPVNSDPSLHQKPSLALLLHDAWHPALDHRAHEVFESSNIPWLRGCVQLGEGVVGPLVVPHAPGCPRCADWRRLLAGNEREETLAILHLLEEQGGLDRDPLASCTALSQMAHLIAAEARRVLQEQKPMLDRAVFIVNMASLTATRHFLLPDSLCPVCGSRPDDSAEAARITLQPNPKLDPNGYRTRSLNEFKDVLLRDYLDSNIGFLNRDQLDLVSPFAAMTLNLPLLHTDEVTAGRTHSYAESKITGILEALERYCGVAPHAKRTVVRDTYRHLAAHALNPARVGVHEKNNYARPRFPFQEYHPNRPLDWVWGYSFYRERPILVPEMLAYYSLGQGDGFVYETSNGCALGGSLEEAILYGLLEVVERDAFLMTWYARLPLPRLDLESMQDTELQWMIQRIRTVGGYDLHLYNATMENGIPSIFALAKNRKSYGLNLICAAGAHLDPIRAVKSAVHELAGMMLVLDRKYEFHREQCLAMYRDSAKVQAMDDHMMLYGLPEAEERLDFLLKSDRPMQTIQEAFPPRAKRADLTDDVRDLLGVFRRLNLEVIVVNQTTPEVARNGFSCVKVLIPGMLPMTFGHHLIRVKGLERVLKVPAQLGYVKKKLTRQGLNSDPHPFP
ncbi:TOMM precursor leader peptide-binding protein [Tumebacillus flagellatus]|uniref:Bacteriocin biosynthesis protein SagD n=1 Tax=Tumebacillus flagellatus TaxID=1157490 RepID=A0A074LUZ5_9BACL|nr:TOMM precursor leader peptide-binding protein [Tumebacillus flagellatus]KEO83763.1 bacteriocin biosynthesis protein SagD [Tumebacillus flagellatus]